MNIDRNRAAALHFFELFSASDIDGALALMTEDATWRIPGKKELSPTAGLYTKAKIERLFRRMLDGLRRRVRLATAGKFGEWISHVPAVRMRVQVRRTAAG